MTWEYPWFLTREKVNDSFVKKFIAMELLAKLQTTEPVAKLVSGDRLPHAGPFSSWNFDPISTWDCRSSTQSFAIGSTSFDYLNDADGNRRTLNPGRFSNNTWP